MPSSPSRTAPTPTPVSAAAATSCFYPGKGTENNHKEHKEHKAERKFIVRKGESQNPFAGEARPTPLLHSAPVRTLFFFSALCSLCSLWLLPFLILKPRPPDARGFRGR